MPLAFAYGSNMDRAAMARRCPRSVAVGTARLAGHRFVLTEAGFASVARDRSGTVHGVLWDLAAADVGSLDRYENVAGGLYTKHHLHVLLAVGSRRALVYVATGSGVERAPVGYLDGIVAAARATGLPDFYVAELGRLAPSSHRDGRVPGVPPRVVRPRFATPLDGGR